MGLRRSGKKTPRYPSTTAPPLSGKNVAIPALATRDRYRLRNSVAGQWSWVRARSKVSSGVRRATLRLGVWRGV
jgi:hypothetical protein